MTLTNSGLFSQLLQYFPRTEFQRLVQKHQAHRNAKGFSCYAQFVAMLFCQLARAESLREIVNGLRSCAGKLRHLGLEKVPARSTLSYANAHRPPELYQDLFFTVLSRLRAQSQFRQQGRRFRFKNQLLSLDSSVISLSLKLFPWSDFNRSKGGIKLHLVLDHADYLPHYACITEARSHDVTVARELVLPKGSIVALDRAYIDYRLLSAWDEQGVYFVTRCKADLCYTVLEQRTLPADPSILSDELLKLGARKARPACKPLVRRISVQTEDERGQPRILVLLTNQLKFSATTIAAIYKERWQIELFFKALKQNLNLRSFVGTTENALLVQIWTALIALMLLKWLHFLSQFRWGLSNLAAALRWNLFSYRELEHFLNSPWDPPPPPTSRPQQLSLQLALLDS